MRFPRSTKMACAIFPCIFAWACRIGVAASAAAASTEPCTLHLAGAVLLGTRSVAAYDIMGADGLEPLDAEDVPREDSTWVPAKQRKGKRNMAFSRAGSRWNNAIIRIYKATNATSRLTAG